MSSILIERDLKNVAARFWWRGLWRSLTWVWVLALCGAWLASGWARLNDRPWPFAMLLIVTLVTASVVVIGAWVQRIDLRWVAQKVEQAHPELQTKLLAAFEQEQQSFPGQRGFLQAAVIEQAGSHSLTHEHWRQTVPSRQLLVWSSVQWAALLMLVATFLIHLPWSSALVGAAFTLGEPSSETAVEKIDVEIEPGNVELERGADLLVLARFAEPQRLPRDVTLWTKSGSGASGREEQFKLQQSLSDPVFAVRVPELKQDLTYRLTFNSDTTENFHVTLFDYPELERADAELTPPRYTNQPARRVEDVRQFSVIEGTNVRLICRLNKPVATARLVPAEGDPIELFAGGRGSGRAEELTVSTSRVLTESVRWRLELTDEKGRKNRQNVDFVIDVVRNLPPELKLVFPKRDLKVSPLQEVALEAQVADDFGVLRWGLHYEMTGRKTQTITLGEKLAPSQQQVGQQMIALENLQAKPDELLAWHVWAEDLGPDGKVRRTTSDIFFAEVSPFEEIFREQSSDGGEGESKEKGKQNPVGEAAAKQKEIVTAIWNLRRREQDHPTPSPKYAADAQAIADGQQKLIESLAEMKEKLQSPDAEVVVAEIEQQMQTALKELTAAATGNALPPLDQASPAAQGAYQSLLKLRARENRVTRSKSSKSSSSSSSASQESASGQQLDQLEMNEEDKRYETKKSAADAQQTPAQKEREQILNRLRELARRQEDTNQKVKELQAALDAAKSDEEKKQLERQLKRLRDEQRDLLRDVDQLKNKVEKPEHNQPLADASRQLQETRENARQASDALEKGQTQQALAAGTRAENALDKLREDFRKQNSSQVADEVRDLVDRARQLDERQQQIGEQLAAGAKPPTKRPESAGLRPTTPAPTSKLPGELAEQKKDLAELLDKAKDLTERVEGNEPLLSKQLYDTVREAHQKQTLRGVDIMRQLAESGLASEATKLDPQVRQGVKQLRTGIEKAAEGVLGNDVESLRRAKREVDRLAQALSEEMVGQRAAANKREGEAPAEPSSAAKPSSQPATARQEPRPPMSAASNSANEKSPGDSPNKPGDKPMNGQGQPNDKPSNQPGEKSNGQPGDKPSNQPSNQNSPPQDGQGGKEPSPSDKPAPNGREGSPEKNDSPNTNGSPNKNAIAEQPGNPQGQPQAGSGPHGVLTGPNWREWSDALRNVEEFVPGTRLRSEAARVREQAQAVRAEFKRHSKAPNWEAVRETIYEPLVELQRQLNEELLRRSSPEAAVPLDRDPVPDKFGDAVKKYYERLGSGQ